MANSADSLLIICVGNPSRGDDAVGPLIAHHLREKAPALSVIETFQLQPELVEDLAGHAYIVIVDAQANTASPLTLRRITPVAELGWCSHAMSPEQLAGLYQSAFRHPPPDIVAIGLKADTFELGATPSAQALALIPIVTDSLVGLHTRLRQNAITSDATAYLQASFAKVQAHA